MTERDNMAASTAQVHQFMQWAGGIQPRLAAQQQQPQQQKFLTGTEVKIEKFGGTGYHNWSDDIRAILGTRQASIAAVEMARTTSRHCLRRSSHTKRTRHGVSRQRSFACVRPATTAGEQRSIVKGSWGNGLEAWRKLENRLDPETDMNQTFRRHGFAPSIGKMGRQDQMKWQVLNYVKWKLPSQPTIFQRHATSVRRTVAGWRSSFHLYPCSSLSLFLFISLSLTLFLFSALLTGDRETGTMHDSCDFLSSLSKNVVVSGFGCALSDF